MLVLHRNDQQSIIITAPNGDKIRVLIADIQRGKVKVGITAPKDYRINREEVEIQQAKEQPK